MKNHLLLMGFAATTLFASAQQTIYSANNSAGFGTWTFLDVDNDGNNWAIQDQSSVQGLGAQGDLLTSYSLSPSTFNPLTPNNYASSAPINCSTYENLSLRFKREAAGAPSAEAEKYSVYAVSAANQGALVTALASATPLYTETIAVGRELLERTVDLSSLDGMNNVYIVIRHYDCTGQYFLAIDDVVLEGDMTSASLTNLTSDSKIQVYPQPMKNSMTVSIDENISTITLIDQSGRIVLSENNVNASTFIVNSESFDPGIYLLQIEGDSGTIFTQKCIK